MSRPLNLIGDLDVTSRLLRDPLGWRVRGVEEISLESAAHCVRHRSIQLAPMRELLAEWASEEIDDVLLSLPAGPMPRGPLMDFSLRSTAGEACLLPRADIAQREAHFLATLASDAGILVDGDLLILLTEILGYPGGSLAPGTSLSERQAYLRDGVGTDVPEDTAKQWLGIGEECERLLDPFLARPRPDDSAPDRPWLALPMMLSAEAEDWKKFGGVILSAYRNTLEAAVRSSTSQTPQGVAAREFLAALGDYADNYDLMMAVCLPLDEPAVVRWSERRPANMSIRGHGWQSVVTADCITNHLTFKVNDPGVRLMSTEVREGDTAAFGSFVVRSDAESCTVYCYGEDRTYRGRLVWRVAPLRHLTWAAWTVTFGTAGLAVGLFLAPPEDPSTASFIVGPIALAATLLLTREGSTVGSRLRVPLYYALMVAIVSVLGGILVLIALER